MDDVVDTILSRPDVVAAVCSAIATAFAAFTTWRGPVTAAKIADTLRRDGEISQERRRIKLNLFATLMQERSDPWTLECVRAFNIIDIAFYDCRPVREAWSELYSAYSAKQALPDHVAQERLRRLLEAMARELNLSDHLRLDDFARVYYPNALAEQRILEHSQRRAALRALLDQAPAANKDVAPAVFPPRPD